VIRGAFDAAPLVVASEILEGVECIPWFDEGEAPPCFDQVIGACLLPE
jgi:hypothetical protein